MKSVFYTVVDDFGGYKRTDYQTWKYFVTEFGRTFHNLRGEAIESDKIKIKPGIGSELNVYEVADAYNPQGVLIACKEPA